MDLSSAGLWLGFALSLMIFSLIIRDNLLARLAQYVLVGAATGYLMVLVIQDILRPKLFEPLLTTSPIALDLLVPLVLGIGLVFIGLAGTIRQDRRAQHPTSQTPLPASYLQSILWAIGRIALMLIIGVGVANAVTGTIQGTLLPQFWQATRIRTAIDATAIDATAIDAASLGWSDPALIGTAVALFTTIATILHLYVVPTRTDANPTNGNDARASAQALPNVTAPFTDNFLLRNWAAIGKRAIWFAAGVLFARLAASRLSLLIARIEYLVQTLETTETWQQLIQFIQPFFN